DSEELSTWLFQVLRPHLPEELCGSRLVELNDRLRFLCYTPGQEFAVHMDGNYRRPPNHPRAGDCSRVTVQIYLHDVPAENGGATTFEFGSRVCIDIFSRSYARGIASVQGVEVHCKNRGNVR
ncbi:unnamed protein product, partial [Polarella glacialis]